MHVRLNCVRIMYLFILQPTRVRDYKEIISELWVIHSYLFTNNDEYRIYNND